MAVPISYDPNDLKLGRYSPYIHWMQSLRGEKIDMIFPLDPRPTEHCGTDHSENVVYCARCVQWDRTVGKRGTLRAVHYGTD